MRISIGSETSELVLVDGVVERFSLARGLETADAERLGKVVHGLAAWIIERAYPGDPTGELVVQLELAEGSVLRHLTPSQTLVVAFTTEA